MIGDRLRNLRAEYNLTQRELADALGVCHTYISKIERGKAQPGAKFIRGCARVFGLRADDLQPNPAVTRRDDGCVIIRIPDVANVVLTYEQAVELARELMRVATGPLCTDCLTEREGR